MLIYWGHSGCLFHFHSSTIFTPNFTLNYLMLVHREKTPRVFSQNFMPFYVVLWLSKCNIHFHYDVTFLFDKVSYFTVCSLAQKCCKITWIQNAQECRKGISMDVYFSMNFHHSSNFSFCIQSQIRMENNLIAYNPKKFSIYTWWMKVLKLFLLT